MDIVEQIYELYNQNKTKEVLDLIKKNALTPEQQDGILSISQTFLNPEILKEVFSKNQLSPEKLFNYSMNDNVVASPEILQIFLDQKPDQETINTLANTLETLMISHRDMTPEILKEYNIPKLSEPMKSLELLMDKGIQKDGFSKSFLLQKMYDEDRLDLFEKFYTKDALIGLLINYERANEELKKWLLAQKNQFNVQEKMALVYGVIGNNKDVFDDELEKIKDVNISVADIVFLKDKALFTNDVYYLKKLEEKGLKLEGNRTLLSMQPEILKYFLEKGADINENNGETLINAVTYNNISLVKYLLENGANPKLSRGKALKVAKENDNEEIIKLLANYGAEIKKKEKFRFGIDLDKAKMPKLWEAWLKYFKAEILDDVDEPYKSEIIFEPASRDEIAKCEAKTKLKIPEDLKTIYQYCTKGFGLFFGETLYSPEEMSKYLENWISIGFIGLPENDQSKNPAFPENTVNPVYLNEKWLPFAGDIDNQNYLAIDYDPLKHGKMGQIINAGRESGWEPRFSFQGTIADFARIIMKRIENGETEIHSSGKLLIDKKDETINNTITRLLKEGKFK